MIIEEEKSEEREIPIVIKKNKVVRDNWYFVEEDAQTRAKGN